MKKDKTLVLVVDFTQRKLLLKEELNNNSTAKKEKEKMEKIQSAIALVSADYSEKLKKLNHEEVQKVS